MIDVMKADDAFCWSFEAVMRKWGRCTMISIVEQVAARYDDEVEEVKGGKMRSFNFAQILQGLQTNYIAMMI